jgi:hypothetical protein
MTYSRLALVVVTVVSLAGCKSEPRTVSGGTIDSPDRGESTTGRRIPARAQTGDRGATPASESEPSSDPVALAVDAALLDLTKQVEARAAAGWAAHVPLSSTTKLPLVGIGSIMNNTSRHVDTSALEGQIVKALLAGGRVTVAANARERDEAMDEQEYENAMDSTGAAPEGPAQDAVGLMLRGEILDDVTGVDGERTRTIIVMLQLMDTTKQRMLITVRSTAAVEER